LKHKLASLACAVALAATASAQLGNYLGPGVLTGGADNIGSRAGEQVDLRFYASASAVYDNGLEPVAVNSKGNLVQIGGLYGIEADLGAYGVHSWRVSQLGLNYTGSFSHYFNNGTYDFSNQSLTLGYTYQASRRLYFNFQGVGGTYTSFLGTSIGETTVPAVVTDPTLLLFDNRTYFGEGNASMTYLLSPRASLTVGGDGFTVDRQSKALVGMEGYSGKANFRYRLTRVTSVGAEYMREHFQFPGQFGQSDMNMYNLLFSTQMGRHWTFTLAGGAYQMDVAGLQTVSLDPAIAALLGVSTTVHTFAAKNWVPAGQASLSRKFKNANLMLSYSRSVLPGNGVYLTSRTETGLANYNYTGIHKASLAISGGYSSISSVGQGLAPYSMFTGGAGITYNLSHALHAVARYDVRQQEINVAGFRATSYRASIGLAFSPGSLPLSLW
jgi:hypothetical protein